MEARWTELDKREVLSYLGAGNGSAPRELLEAVTRGEETLRRVASPKLNYRLYPREEAEAYLRGEDVKKLLSSCHTVVFFCATLGAGVDRDLARLQVWDMAQAVVLDACASVAIENVCDNFMEEMKIRGYLTDRFSPGYGDLPLSVQGELAELLELERTLGVTVTSGGLMLPQKTVTAVFGIAESPQPARVRGCENCNLAETCRFHQEGKTCGKE